MATKILDKLTDEDIFGLIWISTNGEVCSDKHKNTLIRGEVYSIKSQLPQTLLGRFLNPKKVVTIKFTDSEVKYYDGKTLLPLVDISYNNVIKALIQQKIDKETPLTK